LKGRHGFEVPNTAICVQGLTHRYGGHRALAAVSFTVETGEMFGLLGPNGGGKTTLFRILSTLLPVQEGEVTLLGFDVRTRADDVRRRIGVTFQSPSLDPKLTVLENLKHQAHLYGITGRRQRERVELLLDWMRLSDRKKDRVESLSGGLKRRVEIAKGLLHDPQLLLLDEPSTGLDPGARHDLWSHLEQLRANAGVTVLLATHSMEEADQCDRLGILDRGELVALDTPDNLRASVGGDCLTIVCAHPEALADKIVDRFGIEPQRVGDTLRIERERGHEFLRELVEAFSEDVAAVSLGKPTLEDVFIDRTGHRFGERDEVQSPQRAKRGSTDRPLGNGDAV
jgi:ABC-2 type transport system ATP-binding protein